MKQFTFDVGFRAISIPLLLLLTDFTFSVPQFWGLKFNCYDVTEVMPI